MEESDDEWTVDATNADSSGEDEEWLVDESAREGPPVPQLSPGAAPALPQSKDVGNEFEIGADVGKEFETVALAPRTPAPPSTPTPAPAPPAPNSADDEGSVGDDFEVNTSVEPLANVGDGATPAVDRKARWA